jgi:hypothetical protein
MLPTHLPWLDRGSGVHSTLRGRTSTHIYPGSILETGVSAKKIPVLKINGVNVLYSASRLDLFRFFVVCRAPRGTQQKICSLCN